MSKHESSAPERVVFRLMGDQIRVWIEQESIHMLACDVKYGDPVELTGSMARELAVALEEMAGQLDD
jgi:hypothetical protein